MKCKYNLIIMELLLLSILCTAIYLVGKHKGFF